MLCWKNIEYELIINVSHCFFLPVFQQRRRFLRHQGTPDMKQVTATATSNVSSNTT
jgi:hypothetical protein